MSAFNIELAKQAQSALAVAVEICRNVPVAAHERILPEYAVPAMKSIGRLVNWQSETVHGFEDIHQANQALIKAIFEAENGAGQRTIEGEPFYSLITDLIVKHRFGGDRSKAHAALVAHIDSFLQSGADLPGDFQIQRYEVRPGHGTDGDQYNTYGHEEPSGEWVKYTDHCSAIERARATPASPASAQPASQPVVGVPLPSVCDGKEQDEFEKWAAGEKYDMSTHPLHWLFLNEQTYAARQGWKGALEYVNRTATQAPAPVGAEPVGAEAMQAYSATLKYSVLRDSLIEVTELARHALQDSRVKNEAARTQFKRIINEGTSAISRASAIATPAPASASVVPEGWREALEAEMAAQEKHYGEVAAAAAAGSRMHMGERDCTEGVILGVQYSINRLAELEAANVATPTAAPVVQDKPTAQKAAALSDADIQQIATAAYNAGELSWLWVDIDPTTQKYCIPALSPCHYQLARAVERHLARPTAVMAGDLPIGNVLTTGQILAAERRSVWQMSDDEALRYARSIESMVLRTLADRQPAMGTGDLSTTSQNGEAAS